MLAQFSSHALKLQLVIFHLEKHLKAYEVMRHDNFFLLRRNTAMEDAVMATKKKDVFKATKNIVIYFLSPDGSLIHLLISILVIIVVLLFILDLL